MIKYCLHCQSGTNHGEIVGVEREPFTYDERPDITITRGERMSLYYCDICGLVHTGIATAPEQTAEETTEQTSAEENTTSDTSTDTAETTTETTTNE